MVLLTVAAFLGNVVGYEIGRADRAAALRARRADPEAKYFDQTRVFFDKHGNKALVIGRFVPFVRTYITVVAGVTRMDRDGASSSGASSAPSLWVLQHHAARLLPGQRVPVRWARTSTRPSS